jgi:hypothetical protein
MAAAGLPEELHYPVRSWSALVAVASMWLLGCSDAIGPDELPECTGPVSLEVTPGDTPTFSWTPSCRLSLLVVETEEDGTTFWSIITRGENALAPPVTYGDPLAGVETLNPPFPLTRGTGYRVTVARWTGPEGDDVVGSGLETFEH